MEFEKIKELLLNQLENIDESQIHLDSSFVEDLGADSLDLVDLLMAFEEEFGIEIPDETAENFVTVQDAVDYFKKVM